MRTRSLTLAAAFALGLGIAAAGCGNKCNDQTPPVAGAPNCQAVAGSPVTVPLRVCPKCDQGTPECLVHLDNVAQGQITLEPVAEVCDPNSSCPIIDPASCQFAPVSCTFTAPAAGSYNVVVVTPEGPDNRTLTVAAAGSSSCTF